jgi:hypothetical protein
MTDQSDATDFCRCLNCGGMAFLMTGIFSCLSFGFTTEWLQA